MVRRGRMIMMVSGPGAQGSSPECTGASMLHRSQGRQGQDRAGQRTQVAWALLFVLLARAAASLKASERLSRIRLVFRLSKSHDSENLTCCVFMLLTYGSILIFD